MSEAGLDRAVDLVLDLPPIEQGDGIAALLPATSGARRRRLAEALLTLPSPFGRLWALFHLQRELDSDELDLALRRLARTTADEFLDPRTVAASVLMVIGYAGPDRTEWIRHATDVSRGLDIRDRMSVLAVIARMSRDDAELRRMLVEETCALPTPDSTYTALLMLCRLGLDLAVAPATTRAILHAAVSHRLRFASQRGRAELLRILAAEVDALTALCTPDDAYAMAQAVHDICTEWRWPENL